MKRVIPCIVVMAITSSLLTACGGTATPDISIVQTRAASDFAATLTAQVAISTPTGVLPTSTSTPKPPTPTPTQAHPDDLAYLSHIEDVDARRVYGETIASIIEAMEEDPFAICEWTDQWELATNEFIYALESAPIPQHSALKKHREYSLEAIRLDLVSIEFVEMSCPLRDPLGLDLALLGFAESARLMKSASDALGQYREGEPVLAHTPTSTSTAGILEFSGAGQDVSPPFTLKRGLVVFAMAHNGDSNFAIVLMDSQGEWVELLVNEIGRFEGKKALGIERAGTYILDITADGNWAVTIAQ